MPDPSELQDSVDLSEMVEITRFDPDYYPLQLGNHVLGGGFYATRLYHDLRQVNGLRLQRGRSPERAEDANDLYGHLRLRSRRMFQGARSDPARSGCPCRRKTSRLRELQQAKALLLRQIPLAESSEDSVAGGLLARAADRPAAR